MNKFLFADLDDSLFQSLEKSHGAGDLEPAAFLKDGSPISFTTARQRAFFALAQDGMTIIPATARNLNAFRRVGLRFDSYAVLDYGGVILAPDGSPDPYWLQFMQDEMTKALPGLHEVMAVMDDCAAAHGFGGRARLIEDFSIPFYVVMKDPEKVAARLEQVEREAVAPWIATTGADFFIHRNGNNLAILPKALNKARAVQHLIKRLTEQHGEIMTFGIGDSKSDAAFMAACDYAIVPRGSQLAGLTLEAL